VTPNSFFAAKTAAAGTERFDVLFQREGVVIQRIVSSGTQPAQQFCQSEDEWVLLLRGHAEMRVNGSRLTMCEGEFLELPANTPHEVISTSTDALWLAVHITTPNPTTIL
jgi:cupin 2 domain-containing protein